MSSAPAGNGTHSLEASSLSQADTAIPDSPQQSSFKQSPTLSREATLGIDPTVTPEVIPPEHPFRTLVLCFDGTGDQFDADNSNIVAFFSMLKKDDKSKQMCYYQAGIGTYTSPQIATPLASKVSKTLDMMVAWGLHAHVMSGYEFLMQNYIAGDRICIFGFSRGAYTARALAGMIHKVGLLPACNHQQVPFAYKMFTRTDDLGWKQSNAFKKCFSVDVDIEFIGVWDTVNSVGLIPRRLPFTTSNTAVRTFRHALALDERRAKFKANVWNRPTDTEALLGTDAAASPDAKPTPRKHHSTGNGKNWKQRSYEARYTKPRDTPTDVVEVWFAGCHCDVGGGSVSNDTPHSLARIPLRWMIRECFKTATGIMFDAAKMRPFGLDPATLYPIVLPRPPPLPVLGAKIQRMPKAEAAKVPAQGSKVDFGVEDPNAGHQGHIESTVPGQMELEEELLDAMSPAYDQLVLARYWWALEVIPMKQRYQRGDKSWASIYSWNLARPRFIPKQTKQGVKVHRSVKMRMEAEHEDKAASKYVPRALFTVEPEWVE